MMIKNILIICIIFCLCGCNQLPEGYKIYKTINEYNLVGVDQVGPIVKPYVAIKRDNDEIFVLILGDTNGKRLIKYENKGDYWYSYEKIRKKYIPKCECDTTPFCIEKYIYNDTIVKYSYYLKADSVKLNEVIKIKTHSTLLLLNSNEGFNLNKNDYNKLIEIINSYKKIFKPYVPSIFQPKDFNLYKVVVTDKKYYYLENRGNSDYEKYDTITTLDLNNLGEFGAPW